MPSFTGEQGDFLGEVALGWRDLDFLEGETGRDLDLALGERGGAMTRGQKNVRGTIQLHVEAPAIKVHIIGKRGGELGRVRPLLRSEDRRLPSNVVRLPMGPLITCGLKS